jgi:DNA-directed RNA polymerase specialized sigma24 family protein
VRPEPRPTWSPQQLVELGRFCFDFARRLGAPAADAEDLAQTTLLELLAAGPRVHHPFCWVQTVVKRHWGKVLRGKERDCEVAAIDPPDPRLLDAEGLARRVDLSRALAGAAHADGRLLAMALAGHSHHEIGHAVGLATAFVGAYLARARDRVSRRLLGRTGSPATDPAAAVRKRPFPRTLSSDSGGARRRATRLRPSSAPTPGRPKPWPSNT